MNLSALVGVSRQVAEISARSRKIELLAALLASATPEETSATLAFLTGELTQGKIGLGYRAVYGTDARSSEGPTLTVTDVDEAFSRIAAVSGSGSSKRRGELLRELFERATGPEQEFLRRLVVGELRQGALEGLLVEAVARATSVPAAAIRRATMLSGDLRHVASVARERGEAGLAAFRIAPLTPLSPMLAQPAESVAEALGESGTAALEYKLDGARIQVHRSHETVRIFTRNLNDVTVRLPEIVEAVRRLPVRDVVLDGEAIALDAAGRPHPFQTTMKRFGTKSAGDELRAALPLSPFFFDCLHVDGEDLVDLPAGERFDALARVADPALLVPRRIVHGEEAARAFIDEALARGHEGVMAKALDSRYEAGRRGAAWLKLKPSHTLDLVVIAVEWGSGRRRGLLSNVHLAARNPEDGTFVMLGKTFKGMTDEILAFQTKAFLERETSRSEHVVFVRPELVVEVAFDGLQESPHYPAGLALRFARVKRYRPDKTAAEADTIDTVRAIYEKSRGR